MKRRSLFIPWACLIVVGLALAPFPGRWAVLKDLLPILAVGLFYWRFGDTAERAGLGRPSQGWLPCLGLGLLLAIAVYGLEVVTTKPLARFLFEEPKDLSLFEPIQGSLPMLVLYLAFMWLLAGFGEEFVWRGFVLREIGQSSARLPHPWIFATLLSALFFGLIHSYQGPRGVFETAISGVVTGAIYVRSGRSSIWLVVFVHGFLNTISFVAIYFDIYYVINFLSR